MTIDAATIEEFKRLTLEILKHDGPQGILAGLVYELGGILDEASSIHIDEKQDVFKGESALSEGIAISPTQAAMCFSDFTRTAIFLRGLHDAIAEAVESKSAGLVRILYAGSGPYAALAVPLMTLFPPEKVRFTLLDIHPESINSAKSVVQQLGFNESVEDYVITDACEYIIPDDTVPDIILSETMSTALESEPQVAIMRHLLTQAPNAALVPELIQIDANLVDTSNEPDRIIPESESPSAESQPDRIPVGHVFELSASTIASWPSPSEDRLPAAMLEFPAAPTSSFHPFFFTTITTYGEHILRTHDCHLTGIREIEGIDDLTSPRAFQFHYILGANPQLVTEAAG